MKAFHSTRVVGSGGITEATVMVQHGRITGVLPGRHQPSDHQFISFGDLLLMPGLVDTHVHINEPGRTEWEGFDTATRAALAGGITTLVEMPLNAYPVTTTVHALELKKSAARGKLHTHTGFWGGVVPGNGAELEWLIKNGVLGFKAFMTHSGIDEFPEVGEAELKAAMTVCCKYGLPLLAHAELSRPVPQQAGDPRSYQYYLDSRPHEWEDEAIALLIRLCEATGCRVHIVHLSSAHSIQPIREARERGLPLTVETCPHYLCFNAEYIPDGQTQFKCAPPIRGKHNNDQLWKALEEGVLDMVVTDHSPAPPALKETGSGNFMKAWGGIASLQFSFPAMWTAARQRQIPIGQLLQWMSRAPAKLAGLAHRKGMIATGYDADFAVVDDRASFTVSEEKILHRHPLTPYLGQTLYGVVKCTYLHGVKVYGDDGFFAPGRGELILGEN